MVSLADNFHENLNAEVAVNRQQKEEAYRLRFHVYCTERGYEDQEKFPDQFEQDQYDPESIQALVRHRESSLPMGVVRLVLPSPYHPDREFPIEKYFGDSFDDSTLQQFNFSRSRIAEVSRFAISKTALQQVSPKHLNSRIQLATSSGSQHIRNSSYEPKLLIPHISLGLIAMLFVISLHEGITHWYAAMEPSLSRLLTRLGIKFTKIGPLMDYHGKRQPMIADVNALLNDIYHERNDFYQLIKKIGGVPDGMDVAHIKLRRSLTQHRASFS